MCTNPPGRLLYLLLAAALFLPTPAEARDARPVTIQTPPSFIQVRPAALDAPDTTAPSARPVPPALSPSGTAPHTVLTSPALTEQPAPADSVATAFASCQGLLCPVRRTEHRIRHYSDQNRRWLAPVLAGGAVVTQGLLHGAFYSKSLNNGVFDDKDLHAISYLHASFIWSLAYVAGAGPGDALGTSIVADFFFQGMLNIGLGHGFIDAGESTCWATWGSLCVPKPFTGGARFAQLGVGVLVIVGPRLVRRIF